MSEIFAKKSHCYNLACYSSIPYNLVGVWIGLFEEVESSHKTPIRIR